MFELTSSYPPLKDVKYGGIGQKSTIVAVRGKEILIQKDENYCSFFVDIATGREDAIVNATIDPSVGYPRIKIESIKQMMDSGYRIFEISTVEDAINFMRTPGGYEQ